LKRYGIERQTLLATMIPILVMAVLLDTYFISTRFADLDRSLLERSQLLTRQLASSSEYAVFSGNTQLLKQNVDAAMGFQDVSAIAIFDDQLHVLLTSNGAALQAGLADTGMSPSLSQDRDKLRLHEPIMATQIDLDGADTAPESVKKLGAVVVEISKYRLNQQKEEILLLSLLSTLLVFGVAMVLVYRTARSITQPILQIHQAVSRIGEGELSANLSEQSRIQELHELSRGINEMSRQLLRDRGMLENRIVEVTDGLRETREEVEQVYQEKEALNESLALALSELQAIMEANPDILYVFNSQGKLTQWNSSLAKFCGLSIDQLRERHITDFVRNQDRVLAADWINRVYENGAASIELQLVRGDGVCVPFACNGVLLKTRGGVVKGFTGTGRDMSERRAAVEHIHHMAHFDMLTDLPNRALLSDRLQQAIMVCRREGTRLALMFLDLDMFKFINDEHGHEIGDLLLQEVARRIQGCLRETDTAARIGGDEFVVLLSAIDTPDTAMLVAEKIRLALCTPFTVVGRSLQISTSIGIALFPEHGGSEKILLKNADTAMYLAKKEGRNTVLFFPA
jgi:diguanylate cyclase (GGDEF)-like protein/PAS domain S-box-containing protein